MHNVQKKDSMFQRQHIVKIFNFHKMANPNILKDQVNLPKTSKIISKTNFKPTYLLLINFLMKYLKISKEKLAVSLLAKNVS